MVDINLTIVIQAINFLILVFILKKVLWNPLMRHIDRRDGLIVGRKDETEKLNSEAQEMREDYKSRIRSARKEGIQLQNKLIRDGRIARLSLIDKAMDESDRVVMDGEKKLLAEKQAALAGVKDDEISSMAGQIVSKMLTAKNTEISHAK